MKQRILPCLTQKVRPLSASICGTSLPCLRSRFVPLRSACLSVVCEESAKNNTERLRLHNLSPQDGSRKKKTRKGRGYSAGQGGSCGFGMRGQKSRSGPGIRTGFEGGQTPLYRRLPKLRGIAGGMSSGLNKFVTVNVKDLNKKFAEGETVTLESLKERRVLHISGREKKLPLKILGDGELLKPLVIKAVQFSKGAVEKIVAAGGSYEELPTKPKWTRQMHDEMIKEGKIRLVSKRTKLRIERERVRAEKKAALKKP